MQPQISDIFTFDPEYVYKIVLINGVVLTGTIIDARDNGIILNELQHIPTDKILFFVPLGKTEKDETQ